MNDSMIDGLKSWLADSSKKRTLYVVNGLALAMLCLFRFNFLDVSTNELYLMSNDANAYLKVANWIAHPWDFLDHLGARQFFFPFIVLVTKSIGGLTLTVLVQVLFWLLSGNLILFTLSKITGKVWVGFTAAVLFFAHVGMMALLFHGLTETLTVLLLVVLSSYVLTLKKEEFKDVRALFIVLFLLSLLSATKAMFSVVWFLVLLLVPFFYLKKLIARPKLLISLVLVLSPAFIQLGIMKYHFNEWTFSKVGGKTLTNYLYVQGLEGKVNLERADLIAYAESQSREEKMSYFVENKVRYVRHYFENVFYNLKSISYLVPDNGRYIVSDTVRRISGIQNAMFLVLHFIGIVLGVVYLIVRLRQDSVHSFSYLSVWLLLLFIVFISGISYWQGDRLTIPALPLLLLLYPAMLFRLFAVKKI